MAPVSDQKLALALRCEVKGGWHQFRKVKGGWHQFRKFHSFAKVDGTSFTSLKVDGTSFGTSFAPVSSFRCTSAERHFAAVEEMINEYWRLNNAK